MKPNFQLLKKCKLHNSKNLKSHLTKFFVLIFLLLNVQLVSAQLIIVDVSISLVATSGSQYTGSCSLVISDTLDCDLVAVELSDATTDSVMFYREYQFDQTTGLPSGISWARTGDHIILGLGTLPNVINWNARVRLKDSQGTWTAVDEFLFN